MNALDSLFDFAALMSTSSAMTLPPGINNAPDIQTQEVDSPTGPSVQGTHAPCGHENQSQKTKQPVHAFSGTQASGVHQSPSYRVQAPLHSQALEVQYHPLHRWEGQSLIQLRRPDSDVVCCHRPPQSCHCTYALTASVCTPNGYLLPWASQQLLSQHSGAAPQHFQQISNEGLSYAHKCNDYFYVQPYHCQDFLPLNHCPTESYVPTTPLEMEVDQTNVAPPTHGSGQTHRVGPPLHH